MSRMTIPGGARHHDLEQQGLPVSAVAGGRGPPDPEVPQVVQPVLFGEQSQVQLQEGIAGLVMRAAKEVAFFGNGRSLSVNFLYTWELTDVHV